jgi:ComEC/Rec2-related protein
VLNRFSLGGRLAVGLVILGFFGLLTRWEPSVLRAVAMAALALAAAAGGRPQTTIRLLALATAALLLIDPLLLQSAGFRLSVGACLGIALLARPFAAALPGPRPVAALAGVTAAAQVGVAPVAIPLFGGLPVAAIPANLLAVPAAGPIVAWGLVAGPIAGIVGGPVATVLHYPTGLLVRWVAGVAHWGAHVPLGVLHLWHVAALTLALLLAVRPRGRLAAVTIAVVVFASAALPRLPRATHGEEIVAGASLWQVGEAITLVVDDSDPVRLLAALRHRSVGRLDVLVVRRAARNVALSVEPVLRRHQPVHVIAPSGSPLAREGVIIPPVELVVRGILVRACPVGRGLAVDVTTTRTGARELHCDRGQA